MFTLLYLLLIAILVVFSWVGSVYGLVLSDGTMLPNLLSADSVRWFVRHSIGNIASAPIVEVLLVLMTMSAVKQSGILKILSDLLREHTLGPLSRQQRYALHISVSVFVVCIILVGIGLVGPNANLLSVTGGIAGGPFAQGWLPLLCVCVSVPCIVYGWISDLWHTERDVLSGITAFISHYSGYFVTLIVASQLMATMQYLRLFELVGWGSTPTSVCATIVYGLPLLVAIVGDRKVEK